MAVTQKTINEIWAAINALSAPAASWGTITGTLSSQTDLQSALNAKYDASNPAGYINSLSGAVLTSRTLTINGTTYDLSANRAWTVGDVLTSSTYSNPAWITSLAWSKISGTPTTLSGYGITDAYPLSGNPSGFISGNQTITLSGEATGSGATAITVTLTNSAVIGKVLTGLSITGSAVVATDTILQAFGKLQNQINGVLGGAIYQGTWNANTNSPSLSSGSGTKGYYYVVSVAGSTNLDGTTDWKVGDWAIFNGTTWDKVDNTDAVSSVNGHIGAVSLVTSDVAESGNLYFTDARAVSATTNNAYTKFTGPTTSNKTFTLPDSNATLLYDGGALGTPASGTLTNCTFPTLNQNTLGSAATLTTTHSLWGQNFNGSADVSGSLTSVGDITGGASSMTITAGTGNSRTLTLRSTTSGGTATAFITGNADQSSTFGGNISGTGAWTITGGAGNMTIISGTGNSRTMILQTTTSGGTATTALTLAADQSATFANTVNATTFVGALTGTASKATNMVGGNSTTLLGSIGYQSNTDTTTMLGPNTTTTRKFLRQTGDGTNGAAPAWDTLVAGDIPTALASLVTVGNMTSGSIGTGFVVKGVTMTLGSDATGDMYYRNSSGVLTRIAAGSQNTLLRMGASSVPGWSTETWAVPGTSGNILTSDGTNWTSAANQGGWTSLRVSGSDFTTTNSSLTDITGLVSITLSTATLYEFEAVLYANSTTTAGITIGINQSGGGSGQIGVFSGTATNAAGTALAIGNNALNTASASCVAVNGDGTVLIKGFIKTGSTGSPTISVKVGKTTSGTAKIYIGSVLRYRVAT